MAVLWKRLLKNPGQEWGEDLVTRSAGCEMKEGIQSSNPLLSHKSLAWLPVTRVGGHRHQLSGACWPASLAEMGNFTFSEGPAREDMGRVVKQGAWHPPLLSTCAHEFFTCTPVHTTHTHARTKVSHRNT